MGHSLGGEILIIRPVGRNRGRHPEWNAAAAVADGVPIGPDLDVVEELRFKDHFA